MRDAGEIPVEHPGVGKRLPEAMLPWATLPRPTPGPLLPPRAVPLPSSDLESFPSPRPRLPSRAFAITSAPFAAVIPPRGCWDEMGPGGPRGSAQVPPHGRGHQMGTLECPSPFPQPLGFGLTPGGCSMSLLPPPGPPPDGKSVAPPQATWTGITTKPSRNLGTTLSCST